MEMVASAVVQEAVSRGVSFVLSSREEKVSQEYLMQRLEMAHIKLDRALERSRMMPITIMALLRLRKKLKDAFKECGDLLGKARDRQQVVPSLRRKIMDAAMPYYFIVPNQDMLSSSVVGKFEWFATEADKFIRDVESGCSLSHYRFLNPPIRHLLEGKNLLYHMVQGSQTCRLDIHTASVEEYGRVAMLDFQYKDRKAPLKSFELVLALRLYESTNIVGVTAKCLQSLGPQFESLAEVATGELTQVPIQDVSYSDDPFCSCKSNNEIVGFTTGWNPDPFCCIANELISSELRDRFPQEVTLVSFHCRFSASECCSWISTDEAHINAIKAWPPLEMSVGFAPHLLQLNLHHESSLHQTEERIQTEAIDYFIRHPEPTITYQKCTFGAWHKDFEKKYSKYWESAHGCAMFNVSMPITKTRRGSKRRR